MRAAAGSYDSGGGVREVGPHGRSISDFTLFLSRHLKRSSLYLIHLPLIFCIFGCREAPGFYIPL